MLTTIGWIIAIALLALAGSVYVFFRYLYIPTDPLGLNERYADAMAHMGHAMQEELVRSKRAGDLRRLEQDLDDAERLMALEARHEKLATQYAARSSQGRGRSQRTHRALGEISQNIRDLKRG